MNASTCLHTLDINDMQKCNKYTLQEDYKCPKLQYKYCIMHMLKYIKCESQGTLQVLYNAHVDAHKMLIAMYINSIL